MGQRIDRHPVIVDGQEMIAVRPADYERLDASRRQVGARTARAIRVNQQLRDARAQLAQIAELLAKTDPDECVRDRITAILSKPPTAGGKNRHTRRHARS